MTEKPAVDPTMDEILASIRRIISEDPGAPTDTVEEPVHEERMPQTAATSGESLVSEAAASATASAFDSLAATAQDAAAAHPPIVLPPPGRTLEDLTAELLRPLLKTWLDENLPEIVRDRVDEEVRRIARGRGR